MSEVRKREMRREAAALLLLILLLTAAGLAVGVGSAYFSDQDARSNRIKPGDSNLEITEEFHPPDELKPGEVIAKVCRSPIKVNPAVLCGAGFFWMTRGSCPI